MPTPVLFLERTSAHGGSIGAERANSAALELVRTIKSARAINKKLCVCTEGEIHECPVSEDHTLATALVGRRYQLEWDYVRTVADRSPFSEDFKTALLKTAGIEVEAGWGKLSPAMACAWLLETGSISFAGVPNWDVSWIDADCSRLDDDGEIERKAYRFRNSSSPTHVAEHREWLEALVPQHSLHPGSVWMDRIALYPRLRFLDRVENDLHDLSCSGAAYHQALNTLHSLNLDANNWPANSAPEYSIKVADGEHDKRRPYTELKDIDGKLYFFDAHAYFTGGIAGRIYFRVDGKNRQFVIAYVGSKLDSKIT